MEVLDLPLTDCQPIPLGEDCCKNLVGISEALQEATEVIHKSIIKETSTSYRKAPLVISRCPRGGKTTLLSNLHSKLSQQGLLCLSVSFNGVSGFIRNNDETDADALYRVVTNQLIRNINPQMPRQANWELLDAHIGTSKFVILIDEVNALTPMIGAQLAFVLKKYFLDKKDRFLVLTTHHPFVADMDAESSKSCDGPTLPRLWSQSDQLSNRPLLLLRMPESYDIQALLNMDELCSHALTRSKASFFGGIPSLMYVTSHQAEESPSARFTRIKTFSSPSYDNEEFLDFIVALVTGLVPESIRKYLCFCSDTTFHEPFGLMVRWPLCYVACIINRYVACTETVFISGCISKLYMDTDKEGDGMVWEQSVQIAILLKYILAARKGFPLPFNLCSTDEAKNAEIQFLPLGVGIKTVDEAFDKIQNLASKMVQNTLVLFYPVEAATWQFDGYCARIINRRISNICGYQCKDNNKGASGTIPSWMSEFGHLLRSDAPKVCRTMIPNKSGWVYYNSEDTNRFLGWSLQIFRKERN